MTTISIRNLSKEAYATLQAMAAAHQRSVQEHIRLILEREARLSQGSILSEARTWREHLKHRSLFEPRAS